MDSQWNLMGLETTRWVCSHVSYDDCYMNKWGVAEFTPMMVTIYLTEEVWLKSLSMMVTIWLSDYSDFSMNTPLWLSENVCLQCFLYEYSLTKWGYFVVVTSV